MKSSATAAIALKNRLLAHLPEADFQLLCPHLQPFSLDVKHVLYEPDRPIDYAYFPTAGVVSLVIYMQDGAGIEIATIGREGITSLPAPFGPTIALGQFIVQVPGASLRIPSALLRTMANQDGPLRNTLLLYQRAFAKQGMQSLACNGLHSVFQRCCRWLLMTHDRSDGPELELTHEFLSQMLGVRRASVSEVLSPLQAAGLIGYRRGKITVLNRKGLETEACECYRIVEAEFELLFAPRGPLRS